MTELISSKKGWLKDWEDYLDERPGTPSSLTLLNFNADSQVHPFSTDSVKRSVQGQNAAATQVQTAQYLKPLFKSLRARASPSRYLFPKYLCSHANRTQHAGTRTRRSPIASRDHPLRAKQILSTCQRRLFAIVYRQRCLAYRSHHGWVSLSPLCFVDWGK